MFTVDDFELTDRQTEIVISAYNHIMIYNALKKAYPVNHQLLKEKQFFVIAGEAGTGKSVLIKAIYKLLANMMIQGSLIAFTGRAASNLTSKGLPATTAHSLFYEAVLDDNKNLLYFREIPISDIDPGSYIVMEEVGMMPMDIVRISQKLNVPVIAVGDDGQLGPIKSDCFFDVIQDSNDSLACADVSLLTDIKRTGDDAVIDYFVQHIRATGTYDWSLADGDKVSRMAQKDLNFKWLKSNWHDWDVIICGTNKIRKKMNRLVRAAMGYQSEIPEIGERVVCLKNSVVAGSSIMNGELFEVVNVYPGKNESVFQVKRMDSAKGGMVTVTVPNDFWMEEVLEQKYYGNREISQFAFGHAMSCHKIQGSQMKNVIFYDQDVAFFLDQGEFRYTACTRAEQRLLVATR